MDDGAFMGEQTWQSVIARAAKLDEVSDTGYMLKFTHEKQHVYLVFVGEPYAYEAVFVPGISSWVLAQDACVAPSGATQLRVRINVYVLEHGSVPGGMRIFDMDVRTFKDLVNLRDKYGLEAWVYDLCVEKLDARNPDISIYPEMRLQDDLRSKIAVAPRHVLTSLPGDG